MKATAIVAAAFALIANLAHAAGTPDAALIARGQYLTRIGDCEACHTRPGGKPFSGGLPIPTPFGTIYTPNITPDAQTGVGQWSFADFYRAMHEGIGKGGEYLYPAFPFPSYTLLSRDDVKAIWAYLRTVPPTHQVNRDDTLRWPYRIRETMAVWRRLYFQAGPYKPDSAKPAQWNRGAYLVQGLAHCGACHTPRNRLGAKSTEALLAGGSVAIDGWNAPNITPNKFTGIGAWPAGSVRDFLATGRSVHSDALGPMRDVVQSSLQYLRSDDLGAIVAYLRTVPPYGPTQPPAGAPTAPAAATVAQVPGASPKQVPPGEALYRKHCAACHGDNGIAKHDYYPNLRNSSVALAPNPTNLVLIILRGGFQASTKAYPYPYSMPPFGFKLSDQEIAEIANYIRGSWSKWPVAAVYPDQVGDLR